MEIEKNLGVKFRFFSIIIAPNKDLWAKKITLTLKG
jgi:hypothetical protein